MDESRHQQEEADKRANAQAEAEISAAVQAQTQKRVTTEDGDDESAAKVKAEGIATEGKHRDSINEPVADRDTDYYGIDEGEYNATVAKTNRPSYKRINRACCVCMLTPNVFKKQPEPTITSNSYGSKLQ